MSKFYTATCQAKELASSLRPYTGYVKILLKKGEVLRLTEDFNRLQGSEMKLKNEVEELKADNIEKILASFISMDKFLDLSCP